MYALFDTKAVFSVGFKALCDEVDGIKYDSDMEVSEEEVIIQRFINAMVYFGMGCLLTRPGEHFQVATAMLAGRFLPCYLHEHNTMSAVSVVSTRLARIYAQSSERERRMVREVLERGNPSVSRSVAEASQQAKQGLIEAEVKAAAARAVGVGGPASSTLLTTHSKNFAVYIEERLISWLGLSRINQIKGKTPPFVTANFKSDSYKETIVVTLIGRLLFGCPTSVADVPVGLYSGSLYSIYSNDAPCFHRYTVLENFDDASLAAIFPVIDPVEGVDDNGNAEASVAFTANDPPMVPPTSITLLPLQWPIIQERKKVSNDYYSLVLNKLNVSTHLTVSD